MKSFIILAVSESSSLTMALALIILVGVLMTIALVKYNVDGALKIWSALGTLTGLIVGSAGTFFFAEKNKEQALAAKDANQQTLESKLAAVEAEKASIDKEKKALAEALSNKQLERMAFTHYSRSPNALGSILIGNNPFIGQEPDESPHSKGVDPSGLTSPAPAPKPAMPAPRPELETPKPAGDPTK